MPDMDKVECRLKPAWRPVYRMTKGGQTAKEVARALPKALAKLLRDENGIPQVFEFVEFVQKHDAGVLDDRSLDALVSRLEHRATEGNGKLLARAALMPSVSGINGLLKGPPDERLIMEFLVRKVEHELFARQRRYLTWEQDRFRNHQEAVDFESEVLALARPGVGELARKLARNPKARGLKAPRTKRDRKKTTLEILEEPL